MARHPERVSGLILIDGAGKLSLEQTAKILTGIRTAPAHTAIFFTPPE
jgi:pimeloyl-ACP methyl ester carboxylesterase